VRIRTSRREKGKQKHTATKVWTEEMLGAGNRLGGRVLSKGSQSSSAPRWLADVPAAQGSVALAKCKPCQGQRRSGPRASKRATKQRRRAASHLGYAASGAAETRHNVASLRYPASGLSEDLYQTTHASRATLWPQSSRDCAPSKNGMMTIAQRTALSCWDRLPLSGFFFCSVTVTPIVWPRPEARRLSTRYQRG
jgi:hypothetical protein